MFNRKFSFKESRSTIAAIGITFAAVLGLKAGIASMASEQTPYNPSISTISTNIINEVYSYSVDTVYVEDEEMYQGESVVTVQGSMGYYEETMEITTDGDKTTVIRVLDTKIIKEAIATEVHVGTKTKPEYILPVENYQFTYGVGYREDGYHKGLDLICPSYSVVSASADGTVTYADWMDGYGYCVFIDHGDGMETRYAHMNEALVSVGEEVKQGQQIGWSGSTGWSECPHVHMEMRRYGEVLDPVSLGYLNP